MIQLTRPIITLNRERREIKTINASKKFKNKFLQDRVKENQDQPDVPRGYRDTPDFFDPLKNGLDETGFLKIEKNKIYKVKSSRPVTSTHGSSHPSDAKDRKRNALNRTTELQEIFENS